MTDSTAVVKILFVDDEEGNFTPLRHRLEEFFLELNCVARIDFLTDPDVAYDRIGRSTEPHQVVIVDLLFPPPGAGGALDGRLDPRGLELVEKARNRDGRTVVVVITRGDGSKGELQKRARNAGADVVLLRGDMLVDSNYGGPRTLVDDIYKLLCERGLVTTGPKLDYEPNDPDIEMVLNDTDPSGATLRLLIADVLSSDGKRSVAARLSYVPAGASGAHVVRVAVEQARGEHRTYLFKISKDRAALARELANERTALGLYRPSFAVSYVHLPQPASRNDWAAIALVFAERVKSFQQWLQSSSPVVVPALMEQLFFDGGLTAGYRQIELDHESAHPIDKLRLPAFRRSKVKSAAEVIRPSLSQISPLLSNVEEMVDVVGGFVRNTQIGNLLLTDIPAQLEIVEAHGDLHGRNILVSTNGHPRPMIIDLADFGHHHWALDVARLSVDLVLRCVDPQEKWFRWDNFDLWRQLVTSLGNLSPLPSSPDAHNEGVFAALDWMISHHEQILIHVSDPSHRWEWNVALAEQFLRRCYSGYLSDPKRALAFVAAYDQLLEAKRVAPAARRRF